jgi:hypothetical protein
MKSQPSKLYLEILPAAMLSQRRAWQGVARNLPLGGYLIVVDTKNQFQADLARRITRTLKQKGRQVVIWLAKQAPCAK